MVEHNLSVVADICRHVTVLQRGEMLAEGDYDAVSAAIRACAKPIWGRRMPDDRDGPRSRSADDLNAWYGESHVLHGVDL